MTSRQLPQNNWPSSISRPHFRQEFTYRFYADGELVGTQYGEEGVFRFEEGQYRYVRAEAEGENGAKIFLQPMILQR